MRGFKNKKLNNPLFKHKILEHPEEDIEFRMVVKKRFKDPLTRLANEGVRIKNRNQSQLLNSKAEFYQSAIVRLNTVIT